MIRLTSVGASLAILGSLLVCSPAFAATHTLITPDDASRGWYRGDGLHLADNNNYLVGGYSDSLVYRNYLVFDLSGVPASEIIVGATLELFSPGGRFSSADPFELYQLYAVESVSIAALKGTTVIGDLVGIEIHNDLGTGVAYSSEIAVSAAITDSTISIPLNSDFLSYAQASIGGSVAVGGALTTLDEILGNEEHVFAGSHLHPLSGTRLVLTTVPEPAAATMLTLALGGMAALRAIRETR
jgi:hypothetical protein